MPPMPPMPQIPPMPQMPRMSQMPRISQEPRESQTMQEPRLQPQPQPQRQEHQQHAPPPSSPRSSPNPEFVAPPLPVSTDPPREVAQPPSCAQAPAEPPPHPLRAMLEERRAGAADGAMLAGMLSDEFSERGDAAQAALWQHLGRVADDMRAGAASVGVAGQSVRCACGRAAGRAWRHAEALAPVVGWSAFGRASSLASLPGKAAAGLLGAALGRNALRRLVARLISWAEYVGRHVG